MGRPTWICTPSQVIFETAIWALAEGNAIRATARIVQVAKDTVCAWLDRAAQHCRRVVLYLWRDLYVLEGCISTLGRSKRSRHHELVEGCLRSVLGQSRTLRRAQHALVAPKLKCTRA